MGIRIVLADDHRLMREGLCALLAREKDIELIGQAEDGLGAVRLARELRPDIVVTDVSMPGLNGIEATRRIRAGEPSVRVLCLSVHAERRMVLAVLEAGASGYVLKDGSYDELALAIRKAMADEVHLSAALVGLLVKEVRGRNPARAAGGGATLTPREREMVQLLSEGLSTQRIADRLHVSVKTVATHREHVMQKLDISSLAELTRYALQEGLSSLDQPWRSGARAAS